MVDQPVDSKDHPIKGKISISSLAPDHEFHVWTLTLVVCKYYLFKIAVISTCTVMKLTIWSKCLLQYISHQSWSRDFQNDYVWKGWLNYIKDLTLFWSGGYKNHTHLWFSFYQEGSHVWDLLTFIFSYFQATFVYEKKYFFMR